MRSKFSLFGFFANVAFHILALQTIFVCSFFQLSAFPWSLLGSGSATTHFITSFFTIKSDNVPWKSLIENMWWSTVDFFFLKSHPHYVLKYAEYDELTSQLCIQGIKKKICIFFLLWLQSHRCPNIKESKNILQLKKKKKGMLTYFKLEVLTLCFWNLHKNQVHRSTSDEVDGLCFIPYGGQNISCV